MPTRRIFLRNSALAMVGVGAAPMWLQRALYAAGAPSPRRKILVAIFQRGAADGLNIVVPHGDPRYYELRPTIAVPRPSRTAGEEAAIDLDGFFGLHPALAPLKPLWDQRHLAMVHAAGSPDSTRSHFDAQDYMESGTPGVKSTEDGWLNRCLHENSVATNPAPFRAVAIGTALPRILSGSVPAVAMSNIRDFAVGGANPAAAPLSSSFESMYEQSVDAVLHGSGNETFEAVKMLRSADPASYRPAPGADYPRGRFGD